MIVLSSHVYTCKNNSGSFLEIKNPNSLFVSHHLIVNPLLVLLVSDFCVYVCASTFVLIHLFKKKKKKKKIAVSEISQDPLMFYFHLNVKWCIRFDHFVETHLFISLSKPQRNDGGIFSPLLFPHSIKGNPQFLRKLIGTISVSSSQSTRPKKSFHVWVCLQIS